MGIPDSLKASGSGSKITLDLIGHGQDAAGFYSTGDCIQGIVNITVDHELPFDKIEIVFQGTSKTSLERMPYPGRIEAEQILLKSHYPAYKIQYPSSRVFQRGHTYKFPFDFTIPHNTPHDVCRHVDERFPTTLPPTLGDRNLRLSVNDLSSDLCCISYFIRVDVLQAPWDKPSTLRSILHFTRHIRIMPTSTPEKTPSARNTPIQKKRNIRKGVTRSKLGTLFAETSQPKPIQLLLPGSEADEVSTVAVLNLRFEPKNGTQSIPPQLDSICSKLEVTTSFTSSPWADFSQSPFGEYVKILPLSCMRVASDQWAKHSSSLGSSGKASSSSQFIDEPCYTASLTVPIILPRSKFLVPTFQSCLVSRVYSLDISLSYHVSPRSHVSSTVSLQVPVQIVNLSKNQKSA